MGKIGKSIPILYGYNGETKVIQYQTHYRGSWGVYFVKTVRRNRIVLRNIGHKIGRVLFQQVMNLTPTEPQKNINDIRGWLYIRHISNILMKNGRDDDWKLMNVDNL